MSKNKASGSDAGKNETSHPIPFVPKGWVVRDSGVFKWEKIPGQKEPELIQKIAAPVWIEGFGRSLDTGEQSLHLASQTGQGIVRATIERSAAFTARDALKTLAAKGFPINDTNKWFFVEWVAGLEAGSLAILPTTRLVGTCGWRGDESYPDTFILGNTIFRRGGISEHVDFDTSSDFPASLVGQYQTGGTEEAWKKSLAVAAELPFLLLAPCVAGGSVLLQPLRAEQGALVQYALESGMGKTIAAKFALSFFGKNGLKEVVTANSTNVSTEVHQTFRKHLPFALDEAKQALSKRQTMTQFVFGLTNGHGRERGTARGGLRESNSWQNYVILTGEEDQLEGHGVTDGGPLARTFTCKVSPFGSADAGKVARETKENITDNYGWAGRRFLEYLLSLDNAGWDALRAERREVEERLIEIGKRYAPAAPIRFVERRAGLFSPVLVAGRIIAELYPVELAVAGKEAKANVQEQLEKAWAYFCKTSAGAFDRPSQALTRIVEWTAKESSLFTSEREGLPGTAKQLGKEITYKVDLPDGTQSETEGVAILKSAVDEYLRDHGFNGSDEFVKAWHERGWIVWDHKTGRPGRNVRFGKGQGWCLIFTAEALNGGDDVAVLIANAPGLVAEAK